MRRVETAAFGAAAAAAGILLAFWPQQTADYANDAGPTLHPLIQGDLTRALGHQPAMGWFAILFRAPFAFAARHGSALLEYRLGNVPCVLLLAALGVYLAARARRDQQASLFAAGLVLLLAVLSPMNLHAVADGHPEELLGAALCVTAVVAAASGRNPWAAGLVLGLALATKQWAVLAAGPALLAAPRGRARIAIAAALTAGALTFVPVLAASQHLLSPAAPAAGAGTVIQPASLWWPLGHVHHVPAVGWTVDVHTLPRWLSNLTHPLIVLLGVLLPLALLAKTRRAPAPRETALALLALLFLLRCVLDPMTVGYYHVPLLVSLLALEALHRRGLPLLTLTSNAVMWLLVARIPWGLEPAKVASIYLAWALPLCAYLSLKVYAPTVVSALGNWLSTSLPSSVTITRSSIRTPNSPGR
jgi:hypothetical protein